MLKLNKYAMLVALAAANGLVMNEEANAQENNTEAKAEVTTEAKPCLGKRAKALFGKVRNSKIAQHTATALVSGLVVLFVMSKKVANANANTLKVEAKVLNANGFKLADIFKTVEFEVAAHQAAKLQNTVKADDLALYDLTAFADEAAITTDEASAFAAREKVVAALSSLVNKEDTLVKTELEALATAKGTAAELVKNNANLALVNDAYTALKDNFATLICKAQNDALTALNTAKADFQAKEVALTNANSELKTTKAVKPVVKADVETKTSAVTAAKEAVKTAKAEVNTKQTAYNATL